MKPGSYLEAGEPGQPGAGCCSQSGVRRVSSVAGGGDDGNGSVKWNRMQNLSGVSQHLYGRVALRRLSKPRQGEAGICQGSRHGVSEPKRGEGFLAVGDSGSLVCSVGASKEAISGEGDHSSSLVRSVKA